MKFYCQKIVIWFTRNIDLLVIILATWITWFGKTDFTSSVHAYINDSKPPETIFNGSGYVHEYENGDISLPKAKFALSDLVLYYIYANWDDESLKYATVVSKIAKSHQKFPVVAVNCWIKTESCYREIRPNRFPLLSVLVNNKFFVKYWNPINEVDISLFLSYLQCPFLFPHTEDDIVSYLLTNDMIMVFYLDSLSNRFHHQIKIVHEFSSILIGEWKGHSNIKAVVLSKDDPSFSNFIQQYNLSFTPYVLMSYNQNPIYYTGKLILGDLMDFITTNRILNLKTISLRQFVATGTKSNYLQSFLKRGIVLMYIYDSGISEFKWENIQKRVLFEMLSHKGTNCKRKDNLTNEDCQNKWSIKLKSLLKNIQEKIKHYTKCSSNSENKHSGNCLDENLETEWTNYESKLIDLKFDVEISLNRTLSFISISKTYYPQFLQQLGLKNIKFEPFILVVDWKNEKIHQTYDITMESLTELTKQIHLNNLTNYVVSDLNLHSNPNTFIQPVTFPQLQILLNEPNTDVVVFYYTPWCYYCSSIMNLLVMLARYFEKYSSIRFVSLDTFQNDVPYQYQPEFVPALILHPKGRKSESHVFPMLDRSITLSRLVQFILLHSGDRYINLNYQTTSNIKNYTLCNLDCIRSASKIITSLRKKFRKILKDSYLKYQVSRIRLKWICSYIPEYDNNINRDSVLWITLKDSHDWSDYRIRQYRANQQKIFIYSLNKLSNRIAAINSSLDKFDKLYKGINQLNLSTNYNTKFKLNIELLVDKIIKSSNKVLTNSGFA